MSDPIIQAKADRFVRYMRKLFTGLPVPGDEDLIKRARQAYVRGLSLEKARREKKRKKRELSVDLFEG